MGEIRLQLIPRQQFRRPIREPVKFSTSNSLYLRLIKVNGEMNLQIWADISSQESILQVLKQSKIPNKVSFLVEMYHLGTFSYIRINLQMVKILRFLRNTEENWLQIRFKIQLLLKMLK